MKVRQHAPSNLIHKIFNTPIKYIEGTPDMAIWKPNSNEDQDTPLRNLLMKWWIPQYNNEAHKLILQVTPILIC